MSHRIFVLLSGGIDSTTCLVLARQDYVNKIDTGLDELPPVAISIDYGQRHIRELEAAINVATKLGIQHQTLKIPQIVNSKLTTDDTPIPDVDYADLEGVSPTYVAFRNGLLLSTVASFVHAHLQDEHDTASIFFGAHAEDALNWAYPDCTPEFTGAMANAIYIGTYHRVRLVTPFQYHTKTEIIKKGEVLQAPYYLTWSCYKGGTIHCGICPTCRARRQAFEGAGIADPTPYSAG